MVQYVIPLISYHFNRKKMKLSNLDYSLVFLQLMPTHLTVHGVKSTFTVHALFTVHAIFSF